MYYSHKNKGNGKKLLIVGQILSVSALKMYKQQYGEYA